MEPISINIATYPPREEIFKKTIGFIEKLNPKPTCVNISLNEYSEIPTWLSSYQYNCFFTSGGAEQKFHCVDTFNGYFICCDDDLIYPSDYIQKMVDGIEFYNRTAIVGIHGGRYYKYPITNYLSDLKFYILHDQLDENVPVHILGTGFIAFHTSTVKNLLNTNIFLKPNMTDPFLCKLCMENNIPMYSLSRPKNYILEYPNSQLGPCIWKDAWKDINNERTSIINSISNFKLNI